jgi:hypothetical protein
MIDPSDPLPPPTKAKARWVRASNSEAALKAEIARLKGELAASPPPPPPPPSAVLGDHAVVATPAYRDDDIVPEWTCPSEISGVRLDEPATIGSALGRTRTVVPGRVYRGLTYGFIRQVLAILGAYAWSKKELMVDRGIGRGSGPSLGEWDFGTVGGDA